MPIVSLIRISGFDKVSCADQFMTNLMSTDDSKFNYPQVQEKKSTASTADVHSRMSQVAIANTSLLWCLYKKSNNSTKASFHHFQTAILTMLVHGHETLALMKQDPSVFQKQLQIGGKSTTLISVEPTVCLLVCQMKHTKENMDQLDQGWLEVPIIRSQHTRTNTINRKAWKTGSHSGVLTMWSTTWTSCLLELWQRRRHSIVALKYDVWHVYKGKKYAIGFRGWK